MHIRLPLLTLLALTAALPALAQYKVVGPDGKVTYTDRPVAPPAGGQVQTMRAAAAAAAANRAPLPLELRAAAERFPVTLYTSTDCAPCDSGRQLLQARGIPFVEKTVSSDEDIAALQRLTGSRTVPAMTVGAQAMRGLLEADWQNLLDLAGYPKESKLPRGWSAGPAVPLVTRPAAPAQASAAPRAAPTPDLTQPSDAPGTPGIRF
jgi:glutaredoxin